MRNYLILICFILCFGPAALTLAQETNTTTIGVITDLSSGKMGQWGQQTRRGAVLAQEALEEKGIKLELKIEDAMLASGAAVSAVQKLLEFDNVDAIYSEFSAVSTAIAPAIRAKKKLFVFDAGASSPLKSNPYSFKSYTEFVSGCEALVRYFQGMNAKHIAILRAGIESGSLCYEGVSKVLGDALVIDFNPGDNLMPHVLKLKNADVDALVVVTYEADLISLLQALKTLKYEPLIGTNDNAVSYPVRKNFKEDLNRIVALGFPEISPDFIKRFKAKYPNVSLDSLDAAALSFTHIRQMAVAISKCPKSDVACQAEQMQKSPPDKTMGFTSWKNRVAQFKPTIRGWKNNKMVVIDQK